MVGLLFTGATAEASLNKKKKKILHFLFISVIDSQSIFCDQEDARALWKQLHITHF